MNKLCDNIVKHRKQLGYSQEELALKLGVTRQSISKWERDEANPDLYNLKLLATIFQITVDELIGAEIIEGDNKWNKMIALDSMIGRSIDGAKSPEEVTTIKKRIILYSVLVLICSIIIFVIGFIGFFKTGMILVITPEFLQPTLSDGNTYPAIGVFRVIVVGITFLSIILTSKAIKTLRIGLSITIEKNI